MPCLHFQFSFAADMQEKRLFLKKRLSDALGKAFQVFSFLGVYGVSFF